MVPIYHCLLLLIASQLLSGAGRFEDTIYYIIGQIWILFKAG